MTGRATAKFYKKVSVSGQRDGHCVLLDDKTIRTPGQSSLLLPTDALAEAIAEEWRRQSEHVNPARLPLTGIAYAALDLIPNHRQRVIDHILAFGRSDLLCYRAETPAELALLQAATWDPLLAWVADAHGAMLQTGAGVSFIDQPPGALLALERLVSPLGDFDLAALDRVVSLAGSLVIGVALLKGHLVASQALAAALVDEMFQSTKWGRDVESEVRRAHMLAELEAAERFFRLL
ncbi:MAG TPA: ATP12 family protein [Rhizomicrobium sp.]